MAFSQDYLDFVLDQYALFDDITHKKMFGGVGLYRNGVMFGGIMGGTLHLKVDDDTRPEFEARGMNSFFHGPNKKSKPSYYEVPLEIVEDKVALKEWSEKAFQAALSAKK